MEILAFVAWGACSSLNSISTALRARRSCWMMRPTPAGGSSPGAEGPKKAIDELVGTKFLDSTFTGKTTPASSPVNGSSVLILQNLYETKVRSYELFSANDADNRDPVAWTLSGGQSDTGPWVLLSRKDSAAPPCPTRRNTIYPGVPFTAADPCASWVPATATHAAIATTTGEFSHRPAAATTSTRRPTTISTRRPPIDARA